VKLLIEKASSECYNDVETIASGKKQMKIKLNEISEDGKSFEWDEKSGELVHTLQDLIGSSAHSAQFLIRPINSKDYQMTGLIRTAAPESCSRCGMDFKFDVEQKFNEILIPRQPDDRTGKYAKVNHISEAEQEGPSVAEYETNMVFDMGEYLHEQVALALPFNPAPAEKPNGDCSLCDRPVRGQLFSYNEEMPQEKANNPFEVLKNFKPN
jgi:uncharacterized protein